MTSDNAISKLVEVEGEGEVSEQIHDDSRGDKNQVISCNIKLIRSFITLDD